MTTILTEKRTKQDKLKIGFAGVGWIGKNRLEAIGRSGLVEISAYVDPAPAADLSSEFEDIISYDSYEEMLSSGLDAIVIATPSALHAQQAIEALNSGAAVFCQKPLGRTAQETREVVETAKMNDKLLGVDFSYRYVRAVEEIVERIEQNAIGDIFAVRLVFHNAYGPDKDWFYNMELSGGGCLIDLGVHLIDMAGSVLSFPEIANCSSCLYSQGDVFQAKKNQVEDFATVQLETSRGTVIDLTCSWNLSAGKDAIIEADFMGKKGTLALRNVNGSFYDFRAYEFKGAKEEVIFEGADEWGGRAAVDWTEKLIRDSSYDPEIESAVKVAEIIDLIYSR